jgi:hypothetical protein
MMRRKNIRQLVIRYIRNIFFHFWRARYYFSFYLLTMDHGYGFIARSVWNIARFEFQFC